MAGQRRVDQAGDDGVDRDLIASEFERRRLHQADDSPFRRRVGGPVFRAVLPLGRGGQDDASAAALHHVRREGPDGVGRACQVDVDRDVPVRVLHLEQRMEALDARIGEQDVDAAEFLFASRRRPLAAPAGRAGRA